MGGRSHVRAVIRSLALLTMSAATLAACDSCEPPPASGGGSPGEPCICCKWGPGGGGSCRQVSCEGRPGDECLIGVCNSQTRLCEMPPYQPPVYKYPPTDAGSKGSAAEDATAKVDPP